jgi:iron complex transport system substrate-binding protein
MGDRILANVGLRRPPAQAVPLVGGITSLSEERLMDIDGDILFVTTDGEEATQKLAELKQKPLTNTLSCDFCISSFISVYLISRWT